VNEAVLNPDMKIDGSMSTIEINRNNKSETKTLMKICLVFSIGLKKLFESVDRKIIIRIEKNAFNAKMQKNIAKNTIIPLEKTDLATR
jgi:hypothetical protein